MANTKALRAAYQKARQKPLGEGSRFKAVEAEARASGARNPAAVAAAVGRKAHGAETMARLARRGRKLKKVQTSRSRWS